MKKILLLASITLFVLSTSLAQQKVKLKLKEGNEFIMNSYIDQEFTQNIMGNSVKVDQNFNMILDLTVKEVTDEAITFSQVYTSIMMKMTSPTQGINMTISTDAPEDEMNKVLKDLIDKPVTVKVNLKGEVLEVKGMDELMSGIKGIAASGADLGQFLNEDSIEKNYQTLFPVEYGKGYSNGDTWELENSSNDDLKVTSISTYTVSDASKKNFEFTFSTEVTMEGTKAANGMEMEMEMSGKHTGSGNINMKTGLISKHTTTGTIEGIAYLEANDQLPMDMEIPISIKTVVTTTLEKNKQR